MWARQSAQYRAELTPCKDGSYRVDCTVAAISEDVFRLQLTMPDRETAELVQRQFTLRGNEVYRLLIEELTKPTE